jgi:hypothetical protein
MTREEQIFDIAAQYAISETDGQNGGKAASKRGLLLSAFRDGAHWADSHPHWIPVEEYPKVDMSCTLLVHYVDGTIDICDYYGDFYDYTGENVTRNVTHWMPLPTPPQGKEDKK